MKLVKTYTESGIKHCISANVILRKIGAQKPYFSVTDESGGATHDDILKHWPELADVVALHLAYDDGVPMHAAENGFYWIAGGSFMGSRWLHATLRGKTITEDEKIDVVSEHLRVSGGRAKELIAKYRVYAISPSEYAKGKRLFEEQVIPSLLPIWKAEAEAAIKKYELVPVSN